MKTILETHGWDHEIGYEGLNLENMFLIHNKITVSIPGQVTNDKKEDNLQIKREENDFSKTLPPNQRSTRVFIFQHRVVCVYYASTMLHKILKEVGVSLLR